jgi:hypothetical protein
MPDEQGNTGADEATVPDTPLHAYKDGREEDIEGDVDKLESGDPQESQRAEIAGDDDTPKPPNPEKH